MGEVEQVTVGVKEAAALLGCTVKRVRAAIRRGEVRAEKRPGRFGAEWRIERATLPDALTSPAGMGHTQGGGVGVDQALEGLRGDLRASEERYGQAMVEVGRLGERLEERGRLLAERSESLREIGEREAEGRAQAQKLAAEIREQEKRGDQLAGEVGRLRSGLRVRTWALVLVLVAFAVVGAAVLPVVLR